MPRAVKNYEILSRGLINQCRIWHCPREEGRREGSLNAEARQPRVDGRVGELVLVLDAEFE